MASLVAMLACVGAAYALWVAVYLALEKRRSRQGGDTAPPQGRNPPKEIIGKSLFVLDRSHSQTQAATNPGIGKGEEKEDIFAPERVRQHPRQIPPEELESVFGTTPDGEKNELLEIDYPLHEEPFPDNEADDENDDEPLPLTGRTKAQGVSFEQISEAYRTVVHDNPITDQKKEQLGRVLLELKQTDVFEAIVSAHPTGSDKVTHLIDTYLSALEEQTAGKSGESQSPQGKVPDSFDVRDFA